MTDRTLFTEPTEQLEQLDTGLLLDLGSVMNGTKGTFAGPWIETSNPPFRTY